MNLQQFNMGMARGMAAMNQANAQFGLNNSMASQMARQQQQQPMTMAQGIAQAAQSGQPGQAQRYILMNLQNQGPFAGGWQAAVPIPERMNQVKLLVDSLKLVRPPVDPAKAIDVAIQFERKAFQQSATKEAYLNDQPGQQNLPTTAHAMQDQAQQNRPKAPDLSNADNQAINRRAAELAAKTSREEMREILNKLGPEFCNGVRARGIEPIIYYFRMRAEKEFHNTQRTDAGSQQAGQATQPAQPAQAAQPNNSIIQGQQTLAVQNQAFTDLGRYQGQQADAMRSQEGGEVVVPASFHQNIVPGLVQRNAPIGQSSQAPGQPATSMQLLNRPLTQGQPGLSPQQGPRPTTRAPIPQQISVQEVQRREQFLAQFPPPVQNILRTKPPNEWTGIVNQLRQNNMMQRSASQTSQAFGRQQPMQNGPFAAPATIGTPMQQSLSAGAAVTPQKDHNQLQMTPDLHRQPNAPGKPPQQAQQVRPLNPQEMKFMDSQPVPINTLDNMRRQQIPVPAVKNWLELKEWAMRNPVPNLSVPQLTRIQASHFIYLMKRKQQQNAAKQDIQTIKAQNPQLQAVSDDQVRRMLIARQSDQFAKAMQQQAMQRAKNEPSSPKPPQQEPTRLAILSKEQILQMPPEQRAQYRDALRRQRNEERARSVIEFARQLQPKISQLRPLKLDPNVRSQMAARLVAPHTKIMMAHFDQLLANYPDFDPNEADWKKFVEYKLELFAQYQQASVANKTWLPQDSFSIPPQRLEMMYASPALKQEDAKRRKKNPSTSANNSSSPVSATQQAAPSPQALKQQQGPPPAVMFRCPMPSCQQAILGFVSQTELDQHLHIAHMTDINPGTDQLAFLDATLRDVFSLDDNYNPVPQPKTASMEKTASKSSQTDHAKVDSQSATPSLPTKTSPAEPTVDDEAKVLEEWKAVKIDREQWNQVFGGWDWEDVVPSSVAQLQSDFIERYQQSEEWKGLLRPASDADTDTDKSTSPPVVAATAAAAAKAEPMANADQDDTFVDLTGIDGLNLSGLEEVAEAQATTLEDRSLDVNGDAIMGNYESQSPDTTCSPFELVDKLDAEALGVGSFLRQHGIDYTRPDKLTSDERRLMDFVMETFDDAGVKDGGGAVNDSDWDVDWEKVNGQREQDIQNRVPGTWTPQGFISEPRKRWW
ncbi:hypothetical protein DV735_g341, partial [Chaetothyriales sp. CBS 134920]